MSNTVYIAGYGCTSSAGETTSDFWRAVTTGDNKPAKPPQLETWLVKPNGPLQVFAWQDASRPRFARDRLMDQLRKAWQTCPAPSGRLGVILATTKGAVEDMAWDTDVDITKDTTIGPLLDSFILAEQLVVERSLCVSSACSSSQVATEIACRWIATDVCDDVLVLAVDEIGPFIGNGFYSLKAVSKSQVRPFTENRDGLLLGEAATAILLTNKECEIGITATKTITEGFAATRPTNEGRGLKLAVREVLGDEHQGIAAIVAHGTGTPPNDATEDHVFQEMFERGLPVTCNKWAVGHCMAASGSLDIIFACEALRQQLLPGILSVPDEDTELTGATYLHGRNLENFTGDNILLTTLGFGGINGATLIAKNPPRRRPYKLGDPGKVNINKHKLSFAEAALMSNSTQPEWADQVTRWYQLDPAARACTEAYSRLKESLQEPGAIFLASPNGSNETDREFALMGALNPAKFVHTLPNIRVSSLLKIMDWDGPVYTIQGGDRTTALAMREAREWMQLHNKPAWVLTFETDQEQQLHVTLQELVNGSAMSVSNQQRTEVPSHAN